MMSAVRSGSSSVKKLGKIFASPTYKLVVIFAVISDAYMSFILSKSSFTHREL